MIKKSRKGRAKPPDEVRVILGGSTMRAIGFLTDSAHRFVTGADSAQGVPDTP